jgi:probable rRNA maturation factor
MAEKNSALTIQIEDRRWRSIPRLQSRLQKAAAATLAHLSKTVRVPCLTLLLTNDKTMRQLNRDFRGIAKPTNVLSFPQFTPRQLTKMGKIKSQIYMGDIALGYQYIVGECNKYNKMLINQAVHLLIHGILHLFGYDHISEAEAVRMERLESRILAGLGLPAPYGPQPRERKARKGRLDE